MTAAPEGPAAWLQAGGTPPVQVPPPLRWWRRAVIAAPRPGGHSAARAAWSLWALLLGVGLLMLGNGLQGSLLGLRASGEGFGNTVTGLVMSAYFVGFLAGSTLAPRKLADVGHVRVFAALASITSVAILVHALFVDPLVWAAMRFVTGFAYAGLYVVSESWLNAWSHASSTCARRN